MRVRLKRAYAPPAKADGARVLVDRLWPRGVSKDLAKLDAWLKEVAPSNELRKWYHARPTQWPAFRKKYLEELAEPSALAALEELHRIGGEAATLTLVFASANETHNNATVLKELLEGIKKPPSSSGPSKSAAAPQRARGRR
jgi:uncharacterized protein YeaO (DUF488 family)